MLAQSWVRNSWASDLCVSDPLIGKDFVAERAGKAALLKTQLIFLSEVVHACWDWRCKLGHRRLMWMIYYRCKTGSSAGSLFWSIIRISYRGVRCLLGDSMFGGDP